MIAWNKWYWKDRLGVSLLVIMLTCWCLALSVKVENVIFERYSVIKQKCGSDDGTRDKTFRTLRTIYTGSKFHSNPSNSLEIFQLIRITKVSRIHPVMMDRPPDKHWLLPVKLPTKYTEGIEAIKLTASNGCDVLSATRTFPHRSMSRKSTKYNNAHSFKSDPHVNNPTLNPVPAAVWMDIFCWLNCSTIHWKGR